MPIFEDSSNIRYAPAKRILVFVSLIAWTLLTLAASNGRGGRAVMLLVIVPLCLLLLCAMLAVCWAAAVFLTPPDE